MLLHGVTCVVVCTNDVYALHVIAWCALCTSHLVDVCTSALYGCLHQWRVWLAHMTCTHRILCTRHTTNDKVICGVTCAQRPAHNDKSFVVWRVQNDLRTRHLCKHQDIFWYISATVYRLHVIAWCALYCCTVANMYQNMSHCLHKWLVLLFAKMTSAQVIAHTSHHTWQMTCAHVFACYCIVCLVFKCDLYTLHVIAWCVCVVCANKRCILVYTHHTSHTMH